MPTPTKLESAARRLRGARNVFLLSQVAVLDLARLSASEAARLDFPEARAKRLAEWIGRPDLPIDQAMTLYTSTTEFLDVAATKREESRAERKPRVEGAVMPGEARDSAGLGTPSDSKSGATGDNADDEERQKIPESAVEASRKIDGALAAAGLPEYAAFRAISFTIRLNAEKSRSALMLESLLLSAVAQFEVFISRMILTSLRIDPAPLRASEKTYTFRDIADYKTMGTFSSAAANAHVDSLMYKGMDSWMKFLSKATRTDMEWVTDLLAEIIMRRNVHVHAGGRASAQYLSELGKRAAAVKVGDELPVTEAYLEDALNRMARAAIVLSQAGVAAICAAARADKAAEHSIDQDAGVVEASFDLLTAGRYSALQELAGQLDSLVATNFTRERLRANTFAARKALHGLPAINAEVEAWDVTAAESELVLAKLCLQDQVGPARALFDELVAAERLSVMELATWPILEPLRASIEAEQKQAEQQAQAEQAEHGEAEAQTERHEQDDQGGQADGRNPELD